MVAAVQLIGMSNKPELLPLFTDRMRDYGFRRTAA